MKIYCTARSLFLVAFVFGNFSTFGQLISGGIVSLAGDTVLCKIALSPKDIRLGKENRTHTYRYDYVVAVFNTDSSSKLYPGKIKSYFINKNNGNTMQQTWYFSDSINFRFDFVFKKPFVLRPVFLQKLVSGGYYNLWYFEQFNPGERDDSFFILEETATSVKNFFQSTRQLKKMLGKWPGSNISDDRYKNWFTGKQWMVINFNKYKAGE